MITFLFNINLVQNLIKNNLDFMLPKIIKLSATNNQTMCPFTMPGFVVLNQTFQSCTVKMILPLKVALCLGFNLQEVSENNQTVCSFTIKK